MQVAVACIVEDDYIFENSFPYERYHRGRSASLGRKRPMNAMKHSCSLPCNLERKCNVQNVSVKLLDVNPLIPGILSEGLNIKVLSPRGSFRKV